LTPLWRRDEPAHKRLGRALLNAQAGGFLAHPPDVFGDVRGEAGIHGIPRARRWDAVVSATAALPGDEIHFVALADGTLVVDEDVGAADLTALADAVEAELDRPYRAEAVRKGADVWAVAADRIRVAHVAEDVRGDRVELAVQNGERMTLVDGRPAFPLLEFEALADGLDAFVLRAERIDEQLWEVRVMPL